MAFDALTWVRLISVLLLANIPISLRAETVEFPLNTVEGLLAACRYESDDQAEIEYHFGTCIGYIKGAGNTAAALVQVNGRKFEICVEPDTENEEIRDVAIRALAEWKGDADDNPAPIVLAAMVRHFPCAKDVGTPPS